MSTNHTGNVTPEIENEEHAHISGVAGKKTFVIDTKGNVLDFSGANNQAINIQTNSGDSNIDYIGVADLGSATSSSVWQIMKINNTTGTVITWADGNDNFDNIFDNRESLSYS